jgi:hypothetical protein
VEVSEEWKESIVPICKNGNKTDSRSYRAIFSLPPTFKILSDILLSRLTPYAEEIVEDHQCGLQLNRSTSDHIIYICQILEKKWE